MTAEGTLADLRPCRVGLPANEQERVIGPLINKVVSNLPQEKRKGYLFRPQPCSRIKV